MSPSPVSTSGGRINGKALAVGVMPIIYAAGAWLALTFGPSHSKSFLLSYILVSQIFLWPWFLWLKSSPSPPISARWGALLIFASVLATPSLMQTDQLRYIWDGIVMGRGDNPYALSPAQGLALEQSQSSLGVVLSPAGLPVPDEWARAINHPHLPTVYPPVAQVFFGLSAWLNPFFTLEPVNHLFLKWMKLFPTLVWWPWELGWRLVVGCALVTLIVLLRRHRWDLVVFHPLVFLTASANLHVDAIMLPFLALCFAPWLMKPRNPSEIQKKSFSTNFPMSGLLLGLAVLTRWTALILLPIFWSAWARRHSMKHACLSAAICASTLAFGLALFIPGSDGRLFESSSKYAEHWYFFGFAHRMLADGLGWLGLVHDPIQVSKAVLIFLWIAFALWLSLQTKRGRFSLRLGSLILLCSFLIIMPTLHPWYFLPLILLGHRFMKVLWTPWLWPMLAPLSYTYYFENSDPTAVRLAVYAVVSIGIIRDSRRLLRLQRRAVPILPIHGNNSPS